MKRIFVEMEISFDALVSNWFLGRVFYSNILRNAAFVGAAMACGCLFAGEAGHLSREVWLDFPGSAAKGLNEHPRLFTPPDIADTVNPEQIPSNLGNHYAQRLRGYINPSLTGDYKFWISSDDHSELWLSTSDSKFDRVKIAYLQVASGVNQWDKSASQESMEIFLQGGQSYFIEVLHKEGTGSDHVRLAWQPPGGTREVIPQAKFESFVVDPNDLNGNELPDDWEAAYSFGAAAEADRHPLADPDQDGFNNLAEARHGMDPFQYGRIPGVLSYDRWEGIPSPRVEDLTWNPKFARKADFSGFVDSAEVPRNVANDYGARLRGVIVAPVSGDYTFYLAGDDQAELHLSSTESEFDKVKIAAVPGSTGLSQWSKYASQRSVEISLVEGERYYIEAILKESAGQDHMQIGWKRPNSSIIEVIPGSALESHAHDLEDPDGDGLPTDWETLHGFDPLSSEGADGREGDPDQDGIPNWLEYEFDLDPNEMSSIPGGMTREVWRDTTGSSVEEFRNSVRYWEQPDDISVFYGALAPVSDGNNYAARARAWLTVPVTGNYTFWVASDNQSELWLSSTESKFGRTKIAQVDSLTGKQAWGASPSQQSAQIYLEEGNRYFLEVLHKEGSGDDHFSLAWQPPGDSRHLIPPSALESFTFDPDDIDNDEMSDTWERAYGFTVGDRGVQYPDQHPNADPDGDGVPNFLESLNNISPFKWARTPGGLTLDIWEGLNGAAVGHLTQSERFPLYPDYSEFVTSARTPLNRTDHFGSRLRGVVIPPVTGDYTFYLSSDDHGELWLSTGESQFAKRKIAWVESATGVEQWNKSTSQRSEVISLQAGQKYYIEALHKEASGGDHLAIGWRTPGSSSTVVIPGEYLAGHARDAEDPDGDEMPTSWELLHGFDPMSLSGSRETNEDPDGDGIPNWLEYQNDTDPHSPNGIAGALKREIWTGAMVDTLREFVESARFHQAPDITGLVFGAEAPLEWGDHYVQRLRGYLTAPVTGDYTFWISSDDHGELWLSTSASKFNRRRIASCVRGVTVRHWERSPFQRSETIHLEAGQKYFIEILHQEGIGRDNVEVAWQIPGGSRQIIPGSALESYVVDPNDLDHNELPDDWELQHGFTGNSGGDFSPLADPDGDGTPNWAEALGEGDPFLADSISGFLSFERWDNMPFYSLSETYSSPRYYRSPDHASVLLDGTTSEMGGEYYTTRARGYLSVPESGSYQFWLGANTSAELWLSVDETKYAKQRIARLDPEIGTGNGTTWTSPGAPWDQYSSQRSGSISLEGGKKYFIEIVHQRGHSKEPHFSIGWARDGGERRLLPPHLLSTYAPEPEDADDDYLPDAWEVAHGLDPEDNGRLDPARQGERGDFDSDGLTNREEYLLGTHPGLADTDGDGVSDHDEVHVYGSSPTVSNALTETEVSSPPLTGYNPAGTTANWRMIDGGLLADAFRGTIEWTFTVPSDGWWLVELGGRLRGNLRQSEDFDLGVMINGQALAPQVMRFLHGQPAALKVLTPYLEAGSHTLKLDLRNEIGRRSLQIQSLRVLSAGGFDGDENGRPDWLDNLLAAGNSLAPVSAESWVSPAFLEGTVRHAGGVSVSASGAPVSVLRGLGDPHWFANVPLQEASPTVVEVNFEHETRTAGIVWKRWNVLDGQPLLIRAGDSVRVGGWVAQEDPGTVGISIGSDNQTITAASAWVKTFNVPGVYTVTASHSSAVSASTTLTVVGADFGSPAPFYSDTMTWRSFPDVPPVLEISGGNALLIDQAVPEGSGQKVWFRPLRSGSHTLAARLPGNGPIVALGNVTATGVSDALRNDAAVYIGSTADGYRMLRTPVVVTDIQPGWRVVLVIFRSGVTFMDGTTELVLTYEDFVNGVAHVVFRYPSGMTGGYCHYMDVYDEQDRHLGRR